MEYNEVGERAAKEYNKGGVKAAKEHSTIRVV